MKFKITLNETASDLPEADLQYRLNQKLRKSVGLLKDTPNDRIQQLVLPSDEEDLKKWLKISTFTPEMKAAFLDAKIKPEFFGSTAKFDQPREMLVFVRVKDKKDLTVYKVSDVKKMDLNESDASINSIVTETQKAIKQGLKNTFSDKVKYIQTHYPSISENDLVKVLGKLL